MLRFLFALFQESNLCPFPRKSVVNHMTKQGTSHFSSGLLLALKVLLGSSRFSLKSQSSGMPPSGMPFQSKSWLRKPPLSSGLTGFMQRNFMPSLIKNDTFWRDQVREKTTKPKGISLFFQYPPNCISMHYTFHYLLSNLI